MLKINEDQLDTIREQLADAPIESVGYRLMIRPIPARKGMEASEANYAPTLAKAGFVTKTDNQEAKESHGSDVGIVVHAGPDAYTFGRLKDYDPWCKEGDIVIFGRYEGQRVELPPGSGEFYHFMNDDDIKGKYTGVTYE